MAWFKRSKENILTDLPKKDVPDGLWIKCPECNELLNKKQWEANLYVCNKCDYHFRISSEQYFKFLLDEGSFKETERKMRSVDPLEFTDTKQYKKRIDDMMDSTGLFDAVRTGTGKINDISVSIGCMDFSFIGGSMGSVVGEKLGRLVDKSIKSGDPLIIISASSGARMMEGALSLMQMAKISARLAKLAEKRIPYISIMVDPTTGGVTASYAMLGDVNIAEPKALIGFAGPRVIKQATGKDLPKGFQRSEFLVDHGFVDLIVHRKDMRDKLTQVMKLISN